MLLTNIMERRSCLLGLNSPVRVDAQFLIDGEQARQHPTSTESAIRAAIDRIRGKTHQDDLLTTDQDDPPCRQTAPTPPDR